LIDEDELLKANEGDQILDYEEEEEVNMTEV